MTRRKLARRPAIIAHRRLLPRSICAAQDGCRFCGSVLTTGIEQVLLAPLILALGTQPPSPTIQAQQFELVDAAGTVRGVLRMAP